MQRLGAVLCASFSLLLSMTLLSACKSSCLDCGPMPDLMGQDTDADGLDDAQEFELGTDPYASDSDGDGVLDGSEVSYPKICVSESTLAQSRPPLGCSDDGHCAPLERCKGMNPLLADSDADGVLDADELSGQTDPRLRDTDGDGTSDLDSGSRVCRPDGQAGVLRTEVGVVQLAIETSFSKPRPVTGLSPPQAATVFEDTSSDVAGLVVSTRAAQATLRGDHVDAEQALRSALTATGASVTDISLDQPFQIARSTSALRSIFRVSKSGSDAAQLRDVALTALTGRMESAGIRLGSASTFYLHLTTLQPLTSSARVHIVSFSPTDRFDDPAQPTAVRVEDLINGTGVAESYYYPLPGCEQILVERSDGIIQLKPTTLSGTLRVAVRNVLVPRSSSNGFEYDQANDRIVFHGTGSSPQPGEYVYISSAWWGILE